MGKDKKLMGNNHYVRYIEVFEVDEGDFIMAKHSFE